MKKHLLSGIAAAALFTVFSLCLLACATKKPTKKPLPGEFAGAIAGFFAEAAGISKEHTASISEGVKAGVAAYSEAIKAANAATLSIVGEDMANAITSRYPLYRNETLETRLNNMYDTIVLNSPNPRMFNGYYVTLLDSAEINAFAAPNGRIFITRGLIACASTGDALAAIIAHEAAHIQKQHALTSMRHVHHINATTSGLAAGVAAAAGIEQAKEPADTTETAVPLASAGGTITDADSLRRDLVNELVTTMTKTGFSQVQEFEADTTALSLLASAGYKPEGLTALLTALKKNQQTGQGFGKTHPSPDARIANINKHIGTYNAQHTTSSGAAQKK